VNLDAWRRLPQATRDIVQGLARRLEPEFWNVSRAEHAARTAELVQNGMTVEDPPPALVAALRQATATMADDFVRANPAAGPVLAEFRRRVGRTA
ncbi:MAG: c4-dicarboxylate-binding protein, partial [Acetobacteraceae bacterium]|nr:c4-dicarboxylate-binding protein [Acetobacteraceae bacterium]